MKAFTTPWRVQAVGISLVLGFVAIGVRVGYLQAWEAPRWQEAAEQARVAQGIRAARRGAIVDREGSTLAISAPVYDIGVDPEVFAQPDLPSLYRLAAVLDLPVPELLERVKPGKLRDGRVRRWRRLGEVDRAANEAIQDLKVPGITSDLRYERFYPGGQLAAHVLGFVNREGVATMGVERALNWYLAGESGLKITEADARRREIASHRRLQVEPRDGLTVELTLDKQLQSLVESRLRARVAEWKPRAAIAIVSDARTGEILALANEPTFDLNEFWRKEYEDSRRNRAVTDPYEPGSTFKTVPLAAVFEAQIFDETTAMDCESEFAEWEGHRVRLMRDWTQLGVVPLREAFAQSSNRGAARMAFAAGLDSFLAMATAMGFGTAPDWPLGRADPGFLRQADQMVPMDFTRMPAGYALSATPLQIHLAMAAIANGGVRPEPFLIRAIRDASGHVVTEFAPPSGQRAMRPETAERLVRLLADTVAEGTAKSAQIPGYAAAGKTGTAQAFLEDPVTGRKAYTNQSHTASFTGFLPADDPELVITVVVDGANVFDPDSGTRLTAYGGKVAAPLFAEIGLAAARHRNLPTASERPAPGPNWLATVQP